jgi:hypothetical protein
MDDRGFGGKPVPNSPVTRVFSGKRMAQEGRIGHGFSGDP